MTTDTETPPPESKQRLFQGSKSDDISIDDSNDFVGGMMEAGGCSSTSIEDFEVPLDSYYHGSAPTETVASNSNGSPCRSQRSQKNKSTAAATPEASPEPKDSSHSHFLNHHPRIVQLYTTADWWSLWIGLFSFVFCVSTVFAVVPLLDEGFKDPIPRPHAWKSNPFESWTLYNLVGVPILLTILCLLYISSLLYMGKTKTMQDVQKRVVGFTTLSILATISFWLGSNEWASKQGLGYALFAIVLGMILGNIPCMKDSMLFAAAPDGEFFIKCSLVLLAVELNVLVTVGGPAMLVAWIGSPLAILFAYMIATKVFGKDDSLSMLIAVGASWCGASAISAVAPVVHAKSEDVSLAISVVAFFTILFTFAQPYFALAIGMPDQVAGAWIGASVDQTGNVIVSAAILSDEATEIAGIVKMVLNAGLGVMASIIACYWQTKENKNKNGEGGGGSSGFKLIMLWDKFPKFTLGFIITSILLTILMSHVRDTPEGDVLQRSISTVNKWWFAIAFCGIGITTNVRTLFGKAWKSGIIQVYILANTFDILLALGLSYLVYGVMGAK